MIFLQSELYLYFHENNNTRYMQGFQFVGIWVFVGNLIFKCGCCGYKKSVWVTSFENVGISEMWVFFCVGILISVLESKTNYLSKLL